MKPLISEDFLLYNETARRLYHHYAADLPIIDYHCHLPPADIAKNRRFQNITQIWLEGDHYKWRAMRAMGINEHYITATAPDEEKFRRWATTVPHTLRNPLFHWTHMELLRYFGIHEMLSEKNADEIFSHCSGMLQNPSHSVRGLLSQMKVEMAGTTDDPTDDLNNHKAIAALDSDIKVLPSFRPDPVLATHDPIALRDYTEKLAAASTTTIKNYDDLLSALQNRIDFFNSNGCILSDHGLEYIPAPDENAETEAPKLFLKTLNGQSLSHSEQGNLKFDLLLQLGKMYHAKGWTQQFHLGAIRNTNPRMMRQQGANRGYDSIGDFQQAPGLSKLLGLLDETDELPKTILYNLNPADNELFASMAGNFNDGSIKGKIQYGSGWWFLDQKNGMENQINALSNMGLLSNFIGMLTDSRSFLSYPRHEYFRRILCNLIGRDIENGELPGDEKLCGNMIRNICYYNAKSYFGL
ncbi:MAG: glucuronate isomerase [Cyclobacteriaceae bacterium]